MNRDRRTARATIPVPLDDTGTLSGRLTPHEQITSSMQLCSGSRLSAPLFHIRHRLDNLLAADT